MGELSFLVKPASSLCNMRCKYCFYADVAAHREAASYGMMTQETARHLIGAAAKEVKAGDRLSFAFQGGEPTLAGLDFYRWFFKTVGEAAPKVRVYYSFQTNGLLLNEDWCALFREYDVLVGISLDGNRQLHDCHRLDVAGRGTYSRACAALELMKRRGVAFNVLSVLTADAARHPAALWNWLQKEGVDYVQFIPCLNTLDGAGYSSLSLTPRRFFDFYRKLFPLWHRSLEEGRFISVKLFDDLVNQYLTGRATACGIMGRCTVQYVVEANGDIFPCDFYALDQYKIGSILKNTPADLYPMGESFLVGGREYAKEEPCQSCPYFEHCGGGCKRMRDNMYLENGVCFYARLLDEILQPLLVLARQHS